MEYKGFIVKPHKESPKLLTVATAGRGGKIPDVLTGLFTTRGLVYAIIDAYVENKEQSDGKKVSKGGD